MKLPLEGHLPYAVLALTVLVLFYGIYFAKMLAQKQRGIQTRQIGRRKEKSIHTVELLPVEAYTTHYGAAVAPPLGCILDAANAGE